MRRGWVVRTLLLEILKQLVMLPTKLGPFRKLVLAARGSQLSPYFEVLFLLRPLLGELLRYREREGGGDAPGLGELCQFLFATSTGLVGGGQERTRVLMVAAPMLLMSWTASSMTNMRTSNEGILSAGGYPRWCVVRSCRAW
jgi:hypothetical protein